MRAAMTLFLVAAGATATAHADTNRDELWLGGAKFDDIVSIEDARSEAQRALDVLSGLARLENRNHGTVGLVDAVLRGARRVRCGGLRRDLTRLHAAAPGKRM